MIDHRVTGAVVAHGELDFADGHADRIGHTLSQRPRGDLDARSVPAFRMPRRFAVPLTELPNVLERKRVTGQIQETVEQRRAVAGRQHKTIAIDPIRIARIVFKPACPQHIGHWRRAERQARMSAVCLLHHVDRQEADSVDALLVELFWHGRVLNRYSFVSYPLRSLDREPATDRTVGMRRNTVIPVPQRRRHRRAPSGRRATLIQKAILRR